MEEKEQKERKQVDSGQEESQPEQLQEPRKGEKDKDGAAQAPRKPKGKRTSFDTIIKAGLEPYYPDLIQWLFGERPSKVSPSDPNLPVIRRREADKIL